MVIIGKIKCNIIVCGPAVGKTYLAYNDDRFVDIDGMKADYKYNLYNLSIKEKEKGKLARGKIVNNDSFEYEVELLNKTIKDGKIALLSSNKKIMDYLIDNKYDYCLVIPKENLRLEYKERMKRRGNNSTFINQTTNPKAWNENYKQSIEDVNPKYKILLEKGQYLSDIKDKFL